MDNTGSDSRKPDGIGSEADNQANCVQQDHPKDRVTNGLGSGGSVCFECGIWVDITVITDGTCSARILCKTCFDKEPGITLTIPPIEDPPSPPGSGFHESQGTSP